MKKLNDILREFNVGAEEMAQQLGICAALAKDLGLIPIIHVVVRNHL